MKSDSNILRLFVQLQKLLAASSLDESATGPGRRYDQQISQEDLPRRDLHDAQLAEVANKLRARLDEQFNLKLLKERFPLTYMEPLTNYLNRELLLYNRLLDQIKASVDDLLAKLNGRYPRSHGVEKLWLAVEANRLPQAWRAVSFPTSAETLSDFLIELGAKLDYWKELAHSGVEQRSTLWLPAFYEPQALLEAFRQTRARQEAIPLSHLVNVLEIPEEQIKEMPEAPEQNVRYLTGLKLEGAAWDAKERLLGEIGPVQRFSDFPRIRVRTVVVDPSLQRTVTEFEPDPFTQTLTSDGRFSQPATTVQVTARSQEPEQVKTTEAEQYMFTCPIYQSTLRLSQGLVSRQIGPVASLNLPTREHPSKWIKRGVALIFQ